MKKIHLLTATLCMLLCLIMFTGCVDPVQKANEETDTALQSFKENTKAFELLVGMTEAEAKTALDTSTYAIMEYTEVPTNSSGKPMFFDGVEGKTRINRENGEYILMVDDYTYYEITHYPDATSPLVVTRCVTKNQSHMVYGIHCGTTLDNAYYILDKEGYSSLQFGGNFMESHLGYFYIDSWDDGTTGKINRLVIFLDNHPDE